MEKITKGQYQNQNPKPKRCLIIKLLYIIIKCIVSWASPKRDLSEFLSDANTEPIHTYILYGIYICVSLHHNLSKRSQSQHFPFLTNPHHQEFGKRNNTSSPRESLYIFGLGCSWFGLTKSALIYENITGIPLIFRGVFASAHLYTLNSVHYRRSILFFSLLIILLTLFFRVIYN